MRMRRRYIIYNTFIKFSVLVFIEKACFFEKDDIILIRDISNSLFTGWPVGQRPEGGKIRMNKYELALVVSAKIEDDARTAVVDKAKDYITRAGGTVTEVEEWGKKKLAYEIQHMTEGILLLHPVRCRQHSSCKG